MGELGDIFSRRKARRAPAPQGATKFGVQPSPGRAREQRSQPQRTQTVFKPINATVRASTPGGYFSRLAVTHLYNRRVRAARARDWSHP